MLTKSGLTGILGRSGLAYELVESGSRWMVLAPELGARIMGAGVDEENAFWTSPKPALASWSEGGNAGGMRTWLAPESGPGAFFFSSDGVGWEVPPSLDPGNYEAVPAAPPWRSYATSLVAQAADAARYPLVITRSVRMAEDTGTPPAALVLDFRHELRNAGASTIDRRVGLWSILQLPCEEAGTVLFGLNSRIDGAEAPLRPYFVAPPPGVMGVADQAAWLRVEGGRRYKVGLAAEDAAGTVLHVRRSRKGDGSSYLLVAMRFAVRADGVYLDKPAHSGPAALRNGDAVQAYNDPGRGDLAFCEIEAHAGAALLGPGESCFADIEVTIARLGGDELPAYLSSIPGMEKLPRSALPP